jgi:hypothetical protein
MGFARRLGRSGVQGNDDVQKSRYNRGMVDAIGEVCDERDQDSA